MLVHIGEETWVDPKRVTAVYGNLGRDPRDTEATTLLLDHGESLASEVEVGEVVRRLRSAVGEAS